MIWSTLAPTIFIILGIGSLIYGSRENKSGSVSHDKYIPIGLFLLAIGSIIFVFESISNFI